MQLSQQLSQQQRLATARAHTSPHLNTNHQKHRSILSDRNVQAVSRLSHMYSLSVGGAAYTMLPAHPERCHRARSTTRVSLPQGIADSLMQILAQGSQRNIHTTGMRQLYLVPPKAPHNTTHTSTAAHRIL